MSIQAEIARECRARRLHEVSDPWGVGRGHPRRLFVSNEINAIMQYSAWDGSLEGKCYVAANARLEAYARHADIPFAWDPDRKPRHTAFARVKPVELDVICVRVWHRKTHLRMFGCFAQTDWFLPLIWDFRTGIDFDEMAKECRERWTALFGAIAPHHGNRPHDYISSNVTPLRPERR